MHILDVNTKLNKKNNTKHISIISAIIIVIRLHEIYQFLVAILYQNCTKSTTNSHFLPRCLQM